MTTEEKLTIALKCLRAIAAYGAFLPSDGLAKEALRDMGEPDVDSSSQPPENNPY